MAEFHLAASVSGCWHCARWLTVTLPWLTGTRSEPSLMLLVTPVLLRPWEVYSYYTCLLTSTILWGILNVMEPRFIWLMTQSQLVKYSSLVCGLSTSNADALLTPQASALHGNVSADDLSDKTLKIKLPDKRDISDTLQFTDFCYHCETIAVKFRHQNDSVRFRNRSHCSVTLLM